MAAFISTGRGGEPPFVEYAEIARIDVWTIGFVFRGDELSLQIYGRSSPGLFRLKGAAE